MIVVDRNKLLLTMVATTSLSWRAAHDVLDEALCQTAMVAKPVSPKHLLALTLLSIYRDQIHRFSLASEVRDLEQRGLAFRTTNSQPWYMSQLTSLGEELVLRAQAVCG